jgi:hypothetical protein
LSRENFAGKIAILNSPVRVEDQLLFNHVQKDLPFALPSPRRKDEVVIEHKNLSLNSTF